MKFIDIIISHVLQKNKQKKNSLWFENSFFYAIYFLNKTYTKKREKKGDKNMKKSIKLIMIFIFIISFTLGCSSEEKIENSVKMQNTTQIEKETEVQTSIPLNESSLNNTSTVHYLDTGNSDAILIEDEKIVLIDGADNDDEKFIVDYITNLGISKIDYVILTHGDADHCGALDAVINNFDIGVVFIGNGDADTKTYRDFVEACTAKGINPSIPLEDVKFELSNNSYMEFLNVQGGSNRNESSLVTIYYNGDDRFLFTGDIGFETEEKILNNLVEIDVLKVPHHGSKHSSSTEFLNKINTKIGIITCGEGNTHGHPHNEALERLEKSNIELHRTDLCGTVSIVSSGSGVEVDCTNHEIKSSNFQKESEEVLENSKDYVVITQSGTKYHLSECSSIKKIKEELTREEAEKLNYEACKICNP